MQVEKFDPTKPRKSVLAKQAFGSDSSQWAQFSSDTADADDGESEALNGSGEQKLKMKGFGSSLPEAKKEEVGWGNGKIDPVTKAASGLLAKIGIGAKITEEGVSKAEYRDPNALSEGKKDNKVGWGAGKVDPIANVFGKITGIKA